MDNHTAPIRGGAVSIRRIKVRYEVRVGMSQLMKFNFDCMGDALDFAATCLDNGYRVVVIPLEDEDEI